MNWRGAIRDFGVYIGLSTMFIAATGERLDDKIADAFGLGDGEPDTALVVEENSEKSVLMQDEECVVTLENGECEVTTSEQPAEVSEDLTL